MNTLQMKAIFLSILFLFFLSPILAQIKIEGKIIDSQSKDAIPFVNIGIKKLASGTVTDEEGNYSLTIKDQNVNHIISISSIGYYSKEMSMQELKGKNNIELKPRQYETPSIELIAKKLSKKELVLGNDQLKRDKSVGFGGSQLGTEIGALIPIEKETWLKSAHFVVNKTNGDRFLFRINIYDFKDGKVGENLLNENILVEAPKEKGLLDVDLTSYNLLVKNDVLLSLQWIKDYDGKGEVIISFNANKSKRYDNLYLKNTSVSDYNKVSETVKMAPKYALCFYFIGQQVE